MSFKLENNFKIIFKDGRVVESKVNSECTIKDAYLADDFWALSEAVRKTLEYYGKSVSDILKIESVMHYS